MTYKVGINGFGRIGRQAFKAIQEGGFEDLFEVVAVNDLAPPDSLATLLKYDSTYGRFGADVAASADGLVVNGKSIAVSAEKEPRKLPWKKHGVDVVIGPLACSLRPTRRRGISRQARRRSSSQRPPRMRTLRSSWVSMKVTTSRTSTGSFPTRRARRTAWLQWPRSCSTISASRAA